MSVISSARNSITPSILKKPGLRRSLSSHNVKFQLDSNLKGLLLSYINDKNRDGYIELIHQIKDAGNNLTDEELILVISQAKDCMSILNEELRLFVQVILLLKWADRGDEAVQQYKNFVLDLCSAHNYYTQFAVQQLVSVFLEVIVNSYHQICYPSEQEEKCFAHVHEVIKSILKIIPMSKNVLLGRIKRKFPFRSESDRIHLNYTHNLLIVCSYEPSLRKEILSLLITQLIYIDTVSSKEEIEKAEVNPIITKINEEPVFSMEVDDVSVTDEDMRHEAARKLDFCLHRIFKYIYAECHDKNDTLKWEKVKCLYKDFLYIFENVILPTHGSTHIQFVMFYLISFKRKLTDDFISYLWSKVTNTNVAPVIRQAALYYISGLVAHASFVPLNELKTVLQNITSWLHQYINGVTIIKNEDTLTIVRKHSVFYAACQALFYLINVRHKDLVNCDKHLKWLANLNFTKIVTSPLNPLSMCSAAVVNFFAKVMQTYQLAYCFTVLNTSENAYSDNRADLWLDGYFPFECYLLRRSGEMIRPIHRQVKEFRNREASESSAGDGEEDFIPSGALAHSPNVPALSSSPFFGYMSVITKSCSNKQ